MNPGKASGTGSGSRAGRMPPETPPGGSRLEQVETVIKCTPTRVPEKCRRQLDCDRIARPVRADVGGDCSFLITELEPCSRSCREKEFRPTPELAAATSRARLPRRTGRSPCSRRRRVGSRRNGPKATSGPFGVAALTALVEASGSACSLSVGPQLGAKADRSHQANAEEPWIRR